MHPEKEGAVQSHSTKRGPKRTCHFDRFMLRVKPNHETGCLEWQGPLSSGYGTYWRTGAHRWIYTYCNGPIPADMQIDHLCRNRACVFLPHLQLVTPTENLRRVYYQGAYPTPREIYMERLIDEARREEEELLAYFSRCVREYAS
jgi:hypothetical protein